MSTNVTYVRASANNAGAVPENTSIATHDRAVDGKKVQDVYIDPQTIVTTTPSDDFSRDAFGRGRVSLPANRFDVEFIYDTQPLIMEEIAVTGATATHNAATRDVTLAIENTTTDTAYDLVGYPVPYTPGNSQLVELTGTLDFAALGVGTVSFFVRNNGTETVYPQAEWTAPQNDMNWSKSHIFLADFQSLKVGRVRFGFVRNGEAVLAGEIYNDNVRANGYWQYPSLPPHWRIYNTNTDTIAEIGYFDALNGFGWRHTQTKSADASMLAICGTVKSEGGDKLFDMEGFPFRTPPVTTLKTVSTTLIPIISIRVQPTFKTLPNKGLVIPTSVSIQADQPIDYVLVKNGTLTNASFAAVNTDSCVYYDSAATAITGGIQIEGDLIGTGGTRAGAVTQTLTGKSPLHANYANTDGDILTICAIRSSTTNSSVTGVIKWKEIR